MYDSKELGNLSDRDLLAESRVYEEKLTGDETSLNFSAAESGAIKTANDAFEAVLDSWDAVQLEEAGISQAKADNRQALLDELRGQRNTAYADRTLSDAALADKGIPPRDKTKTPSGAPTTAPVGWIDLAKLKHVIHFRDSATPEKKAKPEGIRSCEIYRYIGETPPAALDDFDFLADDTNTPYTCNYDLPDAGKKVLYMLRWRSKSDERGEWSETIEATVNG